MKRYIIGGIIGFMLSLGVGAHAEVVNMIGKVIDGSFPIKINGVTLHSPALTIEGVSYVPTREFAETLGAQVKFSADLGIEVIPSLPTIPKTTPVPTPTMTKEQKIEQLKSKISELQVSIQALKMGIAGEERDGSTDNNLAIYKQRLSDKETELSDIQTQLDALVAQP